MTPWACAECDEPTWEPHSRDLGAELEETVCEACCEDCRSGAIRAWQEQYVKEHRTSLNPGDLMVGHGIPDREQMAAGEKWSAA